MWIYANNEHVYGTKDVQICSTIYTLAKDYLSLIFYRFETRYVDSTTN